MPRSLLPLAGCSEKPVTAVTFADVCDQEPDSWIVITGALRLSPITALKLTGQRGHGLSCKTYVKKIELG